jgi:Uma2 family endonuclease
MSHTPLVTEANASYASYPMNICVPWLTDDLFLRVCRDNPELRLELTAQGELIIMPPTGSETGWRGNEVSFSLTAWAKRDGTGLVFDSSTGFTLPNGAKRSPDASWVRRARWSALTKEQRREFAPLCPDFVVELRSPTDSLATLRAKMLEYIENGAQLGWLLDPLERHVHIYRPGQPVEVLDNPTTLSGEPVLPGFVLAVSELWEPPA